MTFLENGKSLLLKKESTYWLKLQRNLSKYLKLRKRQTQLHFCWDRRPFEKMRTVKISRFLISIHFFSFLLQPLLLVLTCFFLISFSLEKTSSKCIYWTRTSFLNHGLSLNNVYLIFLITTTIRYIHNNDKQNIAKGSK